MRGSVEVSKLEGDCHRDFIGDAIDKFLANPEKIITGHKVVVGMGRNILMATICL